LLLLNSIIELQCVLLQEVEYADIAKEFSKYIKVVDHKIFYSQQWINTNNIKIKLSLYTPGEHMKVWRYFYSFLTFALYGA